MHYNKMYHIRIYQAEGEGRLLYMDQVRQNPVMFYLRTLTYTLIAITLRLVMLAPLLLLLQPAGSPLRWGALLCPLLLVFVVLPMRYSFADALVQKPRQRWFSFDHALGTKHYGEKLGESLLHALSVAKWGLPLLAVLGFAGWYYLYPMEENPAEVVNALNALGQWASGLWYGISDFFVTLFGGIPDVHLQGGWMEGIYVVGIVLGQAFAEALGDKKGVYRYGSMILPMDESLILSAVDLSGRSYLRFDLSIPTEKVGTFDTELAKEFWLGFVRNCPASIHIRQMAGKNTHHILEAIFKGMGRTLKMAVAMDEKHLDEIPSTKGTL